LFPVSSLAIVEVPFELLETPRRSGSDHLSGDPRIVSEGRTLIHCVVAIIVAVDQFGRGAPKTI